MTYRTVVSIRTILLSERVVGILRFTAGTHTIEREVERKGVAEFLFSICTYFYAVRSDQIRGFCRIFKMCGL